MDFRRVRMREREMAKKLFKSKLGKEIQKEAKKARTFVAGSGIMDSRPALSKDQLGWGHCRVSLIIIHCQYITDRLRNSEEVDW